MRVMVLGLMVMVGCGVPVAERDADAGAVVDGGPKDAGAGDAGAGDMDAGCGDCVACCVASQLDDAGSHPSGIYVGCVFQCSDGG